MRSTDRSLTLELHNLTLNKVFKVNKKQPYRLLSITGLGASGYDVALMSHAIQDGAVVTNSRLKERYIPIQLECSDYDKSVELRDELIRFISPAHRYTLYAERSGIKRRIDCRVNNFSFDPPNIHDYYVTDFELLCPNPYFMDEKNTTQRFLTFAPMMSFPLAFPPAGMTTGVPLILDGMPIDNIGDVPFGVIVNIEAYGGDMVNPMISCDDEYIRVKTTLKTGDIMQIDTRPKNKGVYINGVSTFMFERTSRFFRIEPGRSNLQISADEGVGNAQTYIEYTNLWLGV